MYPPHEIQVWLGASPLRLAPASPWLHVLASDALQTFPLYRDAPPARCVLRFLNHDTMTAP